MICTIIVRRTDGSPPEQQPVVIVEEQLSPEELAAFHARWEQYERNLAWFQAHLEEIRAQHLGKHICVAGQELFAADTPQEAIALARAAHPEDDGRMVLYLSPVKGPRFYAHQRPLALVE
jgi:hypothetical protein